MKWTHGFLGLGAVMMLAGASVFVGCGDDTSASPGKDGGPNGDGSTSGDGGSGTDSGQGDDGGSFVDAGLSCEVYCTQVMKNCTSDPGTHPPHEPAVDAGNQQYNTKQGCLNDCAAMQLGNITDKSGDTVGCRQYHSGLAPADPKLHCPHAGPSGGGVCSGGDAGTDRCATFCRLALAICSADAGIDPGNVPFSSLTDCTSKCNTGAYTFNTGKPELIFDGNDLNCRQYHLEAASESPPASGQTHCPHLRPTSTVCN